MEEKEFDIEEVYLEKSEESVNHIRNSSSGCEIWKGTILYEDYKFEFEFEKVWTEDNGGEGAKIISKKPKGMSKDDWNELEQEMVDFIDTSYRRENWRD